MMEYEIFGLDEIKLFISKEHRFGTDSLLLGDYVGGVKNKVVCDLCSGCGIIPVMLCRENPPLKIYAVEIQQKAADLIRHTVKTNNLNLIEVIQGDLRSEETIAQIGRERVDIVTANPPYYPEKSGFKRASTPQKIARYDIECRLEDVVGSAAGLLKFGGCLKMCMTASRLAECIAIMQEYAIEPKEIIFIGKANPVGEMPAARLFLISGRKGGKSGVNVFWK